MSLEFPWGAFMEAQNQKKQNQQQFNQNIAGMGQALGGGLEAFGKAAQEQQKKKQWQKTINELVNDPSIRPEMKHLLPLMAQHPELMGQLGPTLLKDPAQKPEYTAVPGVLSKAGKPFIFDKFKGTMVEGPMEAVPTGGMGSAMAGVRKSQFTLQDLPSNQGPSTAGGAAYQVKVASRQGKNLIAKAGSSQRLGLAQGDLARAVLRNSPTDEAMRNANFSENVINRWSQMKQKLTSDPAAINNPKIRKEIYDIFDEMDQSATPFIKMQLDNMEDVGFPISAGVRKREMGETLSTIPFIENPGMPQPVGASSGSFADQGKEARYQAWKKSQGL